MCEKPKSRCGKRLPVNWACIRLLMAIYAKLKAHHLSMGHGYLIDKHESQLSVERFLYATPQHTHIHTPYFPLYAKSIAMSWSYFDSTGALGSKKKREQALFDDTVSHI